MPKSLELRKVTKLLAPYGICYAAKGGRHPKFVHKETKLTVYYFDRYPAEIPLGLGEEDAAFSLKTADKILQIVDEVILGVK